MKRLPQSVQTPAHPDDRYIVLEAKTPAKDRTVNDPLTIYFVFDRVLDEWAERHGQTVQWYSESDAALAYERARHLNALERQLRGSGA